MLHSHYSCGIKQLLFDKTKATHQPYKEINLQAYKYEIIPKYEHQKGFLSCACILMIIHMASSLAKKKKKSMTDLISEAPFIGNHTFFPYSWKW